MIYINNSGLKAKLTDILSYSDLPCYQRNVIDNACRLSGVGHGVSRARVFRLVQSLDELSFDSVQSRLNANRQATERTNYSGRMVSIYLAICRKVASQLSYKYGIPHHETFVAESEPLFRPKVTDKRVYTVAQRMLKDGDSYLIVSMDRLEKALRLKPRAIRESLSRLSRHGYILCIGGCDGANYSISFKQPVHQKPVNDSEMLNAA